MIYVVPDEGSYNEKMKVIANKKSDKSTKSISEKYVEIQNFVRDGKYLLDFKSSFFDLYTELFPCNRIRIEIETRPLKDIPEILKSHDT